MNGQRHTGGMVALAVIVLALGSRACVMLWPSDTPAPGTPAAVAPSERSTATSLPVVEPGPAQLDATTGTPPPTALAGVDDDEPTDTDRRAVETAARRFVDGWLLAGSPDDRRAALAPVTVRQLLPLVADIDPAALPSGRIDQLKVAALTTYDATVTATLTDGTQLALRLVRTADGWPVAAIDTPTRGAPR